MTPQTVSAIERQGSRKPALPLALFLASQLLFVPTALWATWSRLESTQPRLPSLRQHPLTVAPLYDMPAVVTDEQLTLVLHRLRPRLAGPRPKINHVDHALRMWGVEARFDDPECLSGVQMRQLLTDHRAFEEVWDGSPLLTSDRHGVAVRTKKGRATASHVDHTLAGLLEIGASLDFPLRTPSGDATLSDLLRRSLRVFSLNQVETEWSTLAYLLSVDQPAWQTHEGQWISFDDLAERLMREPWTRGVCYGNHRLHTLTMLLRADEREARLSDAARARIVEHLQEATARLVRNQQPQGWWDDHWADQPAGDAPLSKRLLATGHALEWWALAPREAHPPRETLIRAGQWLTGQILEMDDRQIEESYTFLTHAGRALALWRGRLPHEVQLPATHQL